jgi:hypothetical protein
LLTIAWIQPSHTSKGRKGKRTYVVGTVTATLINVIILENARKYGAFFQIFYICDKTPSLRLH